MKYFVRTTGERILDESYKQIEYTLLTDTEHLAGNTFINWLEEYFTKQDCVILEDDLTLCKDFKNEIEKVIQKHPNNIINFFEDPGIWENTVMRSSPFEWNQCTYYPKGSSMIIARVMEQLKEQYPENNKLYSRLENMALMELNIPHLVWKPHLVQHNDTKSLLDHSEVKDWELLRHDTIYFKDYLDEANIEYSKAYTKENTKILQQIRDKNLNKKKSQN